MDHSIISVERAVRDLRAGIPVIVKSGAQQFLAASAETCAEAAIFEHVAITAEMSGCLGLNKKNHIFKATDYKNWPDSDGWRKSIEQITTDIDQQIMAIFKLLKIATLLPIAFFSKKITASGDYLECRVDDINLYSGNLITSYQLAAEANVPLRGIGTARVLSFRPQNGGLEQLAIITGDISKLDSVPVRLHSSCLTGDILGSLRCDCQEQLHKAIKDSAATGGGVVLYLNQEGRGIGISNKLRAYKLQDDGHNTYDANLLLGYGEDERDFSIAAAILKSLGIKRIALMTNNPDKIRQMEQNGIEVEKRLSHTIAGNGINDAYLASKKKHGHLTE